MGESFAASASVACPVPLQSGLVALAAAPLLKFALVIAVGVPVSFAREKL
jgi:hypothetical protein